MGSGLVNIPGNLRLQQLQLSSQYKESVSDSTNGPYCLRYFDNMGTI